VARAAQAGTARQLGGWGLLPDAGPRALVAVCFDPAWCVP
jgi:hypothetical protein